MARSSWARARTSTWRPCCGKRAPPERARAATAARRAAATLCCHRWPSSAAVAAAAAGRVEPWVAARCNNTGSSNRIRGSVDPSCLPIRRVCSLQLCCCCRCCCSCYYLSTASESRQKAVDAIGSSAARCFDGTVASLSLGRFTDWDAADRAAVQQRHPERGDGLTALATAHTVQVAAATVRNLSCAIADFRASIQRGGGC